VLLKKVFIKGTDKNFDKKYYWKARVRKHDIFAYQKDYIFYFEVVKDGVLKYSSKDDNLFYETIYDVENNIVDVMLDKGIMERKVYYKSKKTHSLKTQYIVKQVLDIINNSENPVNLTLDEVLELIEE
jgi:hypothetical protein